MIALAVVAAWQAVAAAGTGFSPPLDKICRVIVREERVQAGVTRRYELDRRLIFHREDGNLVAELTLVRVWQDVGGAAGRRFEAAAGALKGRTLRFRLAADGGVRSIDDEAALWAATIAGIDAAAGAGGRAASPAATLAHDPAAALAAMPAERRRTMLALPLAALMAGSDRQLAAGSGPVSLAGTIIPGRPLDGTRTVTIGADRQVHVVVHAARTDAADPASLDRERVIDPASGLVLDQRETQTIGQGNGAQTMRQHITLSLPVS